MIKNLTTNQLEELAADMNVTLTGTNVEALVARLQLKMLKFEIADELQRRKDGRPSTK